MYKWKALIQGPVGSPYAAGLFELSMEFPKDFPFKPPRVNFVTRIYHMNINEKGGLDIFSIDNCTPPAPLQFSCALA